MAEDTTVTKYKAAQLLGCAPATITRMVADGRLPEPFKSDDGTQRFERKVIEEYIAQHISEDIAEPKTSEEHAADVLAAAAEMSRHAAEAYRWLIERQQGMIGALTTQLQGGLEGWAAAVREEATRTLEAELVRGSESRKDKAVQTLLDTAPRILEKSMAARAGAKMIEKLVALPDEHWAELRKGAADLLGMSEDELKEIDAARAAKGTNDGK